MYILGIDPGSRTTGWAVIEVQGRKFKYINSGVLKFDKTSEFLDRLATISLSIKDIVSLYKPDEISIEALIYVKSVPALSKLAQARGALIAGLSEKYQGKITEYSPNLIKSSVTGHGLASKDSVDRSLSMIFGKLDFKSHDESDALAIALCHALNRGQRTKIEGKSRRTKSRTLKQIFSK